MCCIVRGVYVGEGRLRAGYQATQFPTGSTPTEMPQASFQTTLMWMREDLLSSSRREKKE